MPKLSICPAIVSALAVSLLASTPAFAACVTLGSATTYDSNAPNPWTTIVGEGNTLAADNRTVTVQANSQIAVGNSNAVSLRDNAVISVAGGGVISATATNANGNFGTGGNTVEMRNNGALTIDQGGQVLALGTQGSAEAINFQGTGNTVVNNGTISARNSVAIWSQNTSGLNTVINNATGVIQAPGTVIGGSGNGALDFTNRGMVIGSVSLAGGNDILRLFTGSTITGNFSGGAGNDTIFLSGDGASTLPGQMSGFEALVKNGTGTWTLTGAVSGVTVSTVQEGTLVLTGNNTNYTGQVIVDPAGTLEARAQSLPPTVTDNGLVRFQQPDDGTYSGLISGTGAVEKTGAGVLTLAPSAAGGNSYSGGTRINQGVLAVAADSAMGAATGGITFNGGTLQLASAFDVAASRPVLINAGGGTVDTQGFDSTLTQGATGAGALSKIGSGTLTLAGNNSHAGGTHINAGTLVVGDAAHPGAALSGGGPTEVSAGATLGGYGSVTGPVNNAGTLAVANGLGRLSAGPLGNFTVNGSLSNSGLVQLAGSGVGNTLTVGGGYAGQGGTLALNTYLGADDSPSDRLILNGGSATGTSTLSVNNVGGPGDYTLSNGILLVDAQNGATSSPDAFSLAAPAVAGAREYVLFKGGVTAGTADSWYLRSTLPPPPIGALAQPTPAPNSPPLPIALAGAALIPPNHGATPVVSSGAPVVLYRQEVPVYSVVPPALREMTLYTLGTFHERRGEQRLLTPGDNASAAWGRVFGQHIEQSWSGTVDPSLDGNVKGLQVGVDLLRRDNREGGVDTAGVFFGYARLDADIKGQALGWNDLAVGDMDTDATSLGAYWTHTEASRWYVDAVVMGTRFEGEAKSNRRLSVDTQGNAFTASLETGYPIAITPFIALEPQMQVIWQHLSLDDQHDRYSSVDFNTDDSWTGRVGVRLRADVGRVQPYLLANVWDTAKGTDHVAFGGDDIATDFGGRSLQLGGGVVADLADNVSVYASASHTRELSGEDMRGVQGVIGVQVKW